MSASRIDSNRVRADPTRRDVRDTPLLSPKNAFKLSVFGSNNRGGLWYVAADEAPRGTWEENKALTLAAEAAGIDAMIPNARWKGFGGKTNFNSWGLEASAWAAGLAAVTSEIQILTTVHVPTAHPVRVAKECVTIDHIAGGRFGLNVVAGWNEREMAMFGAGVPDHAERYAYTADWMELIERLWASEEEFDFEGRYFTALGAYCEPRPVQDPRPLVMSAAISKEGRLFAARHADVSFMVPKNPDDLAAIAAHVDDTKRLASEYGREISVMASVGIVCAETEQEARRQLNHYIRDLGDWEAVRTFTGGQRAKAPDYRFESQEARALVGHYALPLVGTPEQVVEGFQRLAEAGLGGAALSWVDYQEGIQQFDEQLRPLMIEAGLRGA